MLIIDCYEHLKSALINRPFGLIGRPLVSTIKPVFLWEYCTNKQTPVQCVTALPSLCTTWARLGATTISYLILSDLHKCIGGRGKWSTWDQRKEKSVGIKCLSTFILKQCFQKINMAAQGCPHLCDDGSFLFGWEYNSSNLSQNWTTVGYIEKRSNCRFDQHRRA
jgi:hypothetical protein